MKYILLVFLLVTSVTFAGIVGDGSSGNPFQITTFTNLDTLRVDAALATGNYYWELTDSINMSTAIPDWIIVSFKGHIDGKGYAIRGWVDSDNDNMNFIQTVQSNSSFSNMQFIGWDLRKTVTFGAKGSALFSIVNANCSFDSLVIDSCNFENVSTLGDIADPANGVITATVVGTGVTMDRIVIKRTTVELFRDMLSATPFNGLFCGWVNNGSLKITRSYVDSVTFYYGETLTGSGHGGFFVAKAEPSTGDSVVVNDCYVYDSFTETKAQSASTDRPVSAFIRSSGGSNLITVRNCWASFTVGIKTEGDFVGQFNASDTPPSGVFTSYYDGAKIALAQQSGSHTATTATSKTALQLQDSTTYVGFDFTVAPIWSWSALANDSYPYLSWTALPVINQYYLNLSSEFPYSDGFRLKVNWNTNADYVEMDSAYAPADSFFYSADVSRWPESAFAYVVDSVAGYRKDSILIDTTWFDRDSLAVVMHGYIKSIIVDSLYTRPPSPASIVSNITGIGTSSDPYVLYNALDIDSTRILSNVSVGIPSPYYALGADIDMSVFGNWSEYVQSSNDRYGNFPFISRLDGRGYKISNLTMNVDSTVGVGTFIIAASINYVTFKSCTLTVTGHPGYGISTRVRADVTITQEYHDLSKYEEFGVGFINVQTNTRHVYFEDCDITVNTGELNSYMNVGYIINRPSLSNCGFQNSNLAVSVDSVDLLNQINANGWQIAFVSPASSYASYSANNCWISDDCTMTVNFGKYKNSREGHFWNNMRRDKLLLASFFAGYGSNIKNTYVGGTYNWTVDTTFNTSIADDGGSFGLIWSVHRHQAIRKGGDPINSNLNLFNGNLTHNITNLRGVSWRPGDTSPSWSSLAQGNGSYGNYYNTDSATVLDTLRFHRDNGSGNWVNAGTVIDTLGLSTALLKIDTTYRGSGGSLWNLKDKNWRINSQNNGFPHLLGQEDFIDTVWTVVIGDSVVTDSLIVEFRPHIYDSLICAYDAWCEIDTMWVTHSLEELTGSGTDLDPFVLHYDTLHAELSFQGARQYVVGYGYTDVDTIEYNYFYSHTFVDTGVGFIVDAQIDTSFDIALPNWVELNRPLTFAVKSNPDTVQSVLSFAPFDKELHFDERPAISNRLACLAWGAQPANWRWVQEVSCGWALPAGLDGTPLKKGKGFYGLQIITSDAGVRRLVPQFSEIVDSSFFVRGDCGYEQDASGDPDYNKPLAGYDLGWDKTLCEYGMTGATFPTYEYFSCGLPSTLDVRTIDDKRWIFHAGPGGGLGKIVDITGALVGADGLVFFGDGGEGPVILQSSGGSAILFGIAPPIINPFGNPTVTTYDIWSTSPVGDKIKNSFRGIHPKIWKWGRQDGTRPDSIWIMTPSGRVKIGI